jgi:K+-transporting ATPase ATPase C chain
MCGLLFPVVVTGIAQLLFPNQSNGSLVKLNGQAVGSNLIAQNFTSPMFFQPRNSSDSASAVDPDITVQDAYSQIPRISAATNNKLTADTLKSIVDQNTERTLWITGDEYVNVLSLNLLLIKEYPQTYSAFG